MKPKYIAILSISIICVVYLLNGNINLNLGDEGHLWYGVLQTAQGEVPIMDFRSYDPGRYYWAMAWSKVIGNGVLSLRFSGLLFFFIGLFLILIKFSQLGINNTYIILIGTLLTFMAFPNHKLYEISLVMAAIYFASSLIENATLRTYLASGIFVGVSAFFARNFGVYFLISIFALTAFMSFKTKERYLSHPLSIFSLGIVIGYLPIILMIILIPGFFSSFVESIYLMFGPYAPVLPIPIQWGESFFVSLLYIVIPAFYLFIILLGLKLEDVNAESALLLASAFIGIPIIHHIVIRADIAHLAQGITPFLICLFILPIVWRSKLRKTVSLCFSITVVILILFTVGRYQAFPFMYKLRKDFTSNLKLVLYEDRGQNLWISKGQENHINTIKALIEDHEQSSENIWIVPFEPGLYPILRKKVPVWDPNPLFPVSEENQKKIIYSLLSNNVNLVLINNRALDGMDSRRFSKTHHIIWEYFMSEFVEVEDPRLTRDQVLLRRRTK